MPDDLALLTGPGVRDLLAAAVAEVDEDLLGWRVRSVEHRPGRGTAVAYDVRVRGRAGERTRVLGASTGPAAADGPGVRLPDGGREVSVWRFPRDPALPALASALDERTARALLDACGVPPGPVELRVRAYRPGRRAVVEVRTPATGVFVKVLRPPSAEPLHRRHVLLREAGLPVPRSLGWRSEGLVVLEALPGTSLRRRLREGDVPDLDGTALLDLLGRLPPALCELPPRRSWSDEVEHYAGVVAAALPSEAERCHQLARRVRAACAPADAVEPVHGDLHEGQLLLRADRITGLLDVDTAGPGRRADDLACALAHLSVLAQAEPLHAAGTRALAERWRRDVEQAVDPADLRARVAGVVVSLATGPHRVQADGWQHHTRARLDLAERWLDAAGASGSAGTVEGVIDR